MPALDSDLRRQLENVIIQAREVSEAAARSALQKRAVDAAEPFSHFGPKEKELRTRLRARGRQVGDLRNADKTQSIDQLTQELAYEFWHRMLFARFLAENHLLMHPDGVAVSLEECEELAKDASPPAPNGFVLAAHYASTMLPQIFRTDDVLLEIDFAPEQRLSLEKLLASLPHKTFLANDSLGWAYQFWQSKRKEEVNKSSAKIDGRTLSVVTQLFTEDYMVQFLLQNTIGAWWCGLHDIEVPPGGAGVPADRSPVEMEYLRWRDDGTPAAGVFEDWPKTFAAFRLLDPCCGSGHFLVAAFNLLVPLRMHDDGLSAIQACEAVLRENIFGLELDPRCTQIAAFALALAAWKYPTAGGYRPLPPLNIACSGQGVTSNKEEWLALTNGDEKLLNGMDRLYDLFQQSPDLGSLIDPKRENGTLYTAGYAELQPLLAKALAKKTDDADFVALGVAAQGITQAARILSERFTLVTTNVPYLGRGKQSDILKSHVDNFYKEGKADLSTTFVLRCLDLCDNNGSVALVTPQNWLFLTSYTKLREKLIKEATWNAAVRLGPNAFKDMNWWAATTALVVLSSREPSGWTMAGLDVSIDKAQDAKASRLANRIPTPLQLIRQSEQLSNPDARIQFSEYEQRELLSDFADSYQGIGTSDNSQFLLCFWELDSIPPEYRYVQTAPETMALASGMSHVLCWENGEGRYYEHAMRLKAEGRLGGWKSGGEAWGKMGIAVKVTGLPAVSRYVGTMFDTTLAAVIPKKPEDFAAIDAFIRSEGYIPLVRESDQALSITEHSLLKVPFDIAQWRAIASETFPDGVVPEPQSDDPTQWLNTGDVVTSTDPLQVAVCRLLGYRWPNRPKSGDAIDRMADGDGILCLPGVRGEGAASEGLLEVLHAAYGQKWSESLLHKFLIDVGCKAGTTLDDWLRNQFFEQHSKRFHDRPFVWHIWDGRKDGFAALVNYHKLDHKALENLTYSYLGDWIAAQGKSDKAGADSRLGAAMELQSKLKLVLAGEPPFDIFVRWKPIYEQPIGWHPDLNDGVRMNIRPFMEAGILRKTPNIKWTKDRGKEPQREKADYPWFWSGKEFVGDRVNDIHLTNAEKQAARDRIKGAK